jgi:hypothetical protein
MKGLIHITILMLVNLAFCQVDYGTPPDEVLPEVLDGKRRIIEVMHFPKINDPVKIDDLYYWKHVTAIMCKESEISITEYGAYIFYNNTWNLRKKYPLKDLDRTFGTTKEIMEQGQPYTWTENWRVDTRLFGGWAMWYFIGKTTQGETVCGYETIHTTSNLLN